MTLLALDMLHFKGVEKLLKSYMKEGTRISKDGAIAASEYLRLFVIGRNLLIFES